MLKVKDYKETGSKFLELYILLVFNEQFEIFDATKKLLELMWNPPMGVFIILAYLHQLICCRCAKYFNNLVDLSELYIVAPLIIEPPHAKSTTREYPPICAHPHLHQRNF